MAGITVSVSGKYVSNRRLFLALCDQAAVETVADTTRSLEQLTKANAPFKTGNLESKIKGRARGKRGVVRSGAWYTLPQETGSTPHTFGPRTKGALWWEGADHPVRKVNHPGNPATHFLRRSIDAIMPRFLETAKRYYPG